MRVLETLLRCRLRAGRGEHRCRPGRPAAERQRRHDGRTPGGAAGRAAARDRRDDARRARRATARRCRCSIRPSIARLVADGTANGGDDCQAARVRGRARRRRGRCRDRGRPRSRLAARGRVRHGAGAGDTGGSHCGDTIMTTARLPRLSQLEDIQAREARHVLQTYRRAPVTFVRGKGVRLYDSDGREYLDLLSGIGVASLGHAHPGLARAIAEQAQTLLHTSNLFFHPLQGQVAERLAVALGPAARLLLQQRHGSRRGLPEVRAALLVHARRAARRDHRARGIVSRPDDRRAVGHVRRALSRAVRAAAAGRPLRARQRSGGAARGGVVERRRPSSPSRFRARAASGR